MSKISEIAVPTLYNKFPKETRAYPISERENLMRALRHEKPKWMPNFEGGTQDLIPGDGNPMTAGSFTNEWGIYFEYSEVQGSATPVTTVLDEVKNWKSLTFPTVDHAAVQQQAASLVRDENLALCAHMPCACFEQLHMLEGFEQALVDLITEPDACRALFEATVDYTIEYFRAYNKAFGLDYVIYHDDWGTARAPFFSVDLMKQTILEPSKRLIQTMKAEVPVVFHNCGLVNDFVPYLVEEIGADGLQIQHINDLAHIIKTYGSQTTVEYRRPETYKMFDQDTTLDEVRSFARAAVDRYGAHVNPGAGAIVTINAPTAEVFNAFDEEMVMYSMEKYKDL
jgi:hypothetical protein